MSLDPMTLVSGPELLLAALMFLAAMLYASVGHAGASAYLALMVLFSVSPAVMRPTALVLNIIVASVVATKFYRAGHFRFALFWPFALGAIPLAFVGGFIQPPTTLYRPLVGIVLLAGATRLLWPGEMKIGETTRDPPIWLAMLSGAIIGLLSGLTGTGGGIFLSPLLLMAGWSSIRGASATAAVFILCNSIAGLLGNLSSVQALPGAVFLFAGAALCGAMIGARLGIRLFDNRGILRALGVVLLIAAIKLIGFY